MTAGKPGVLPLFLTTILAAAPLQAHEGHSNQIPWQSCEDKQLGDPCEYANAARDLYRGSCREMQQQLMCVRNQPIIRGCTDPALCPSPPDSPTFIRPARESADGGAS